MGPYGPGPGPLWGPTCPGQDPYGPYGPIFWTSHILNRPYYEPAILWTSHIRNQPYYEPVILWTSHILNQPYYEPAILWTSHIMNQPYYEPAILWTSHIMNQPYYEQATVWTSHIINQPYYEPASGEDNGDDGGGRILPEHPSPILHAPRDNISRKGNPSLRCRKLYRNFPKNRFLGIPCKSN